MRDPDRDGPTRTCIATRETRGVEGMIRFVAAPDGMVTPDLKRKLPGRGVWVTATQEAVTEAVRKKALRIRLSLVWRDMAMACLPGARPGPPGRSGARRVLLGTVGN